jgi:membrane protein
MGTFQWLLARLNVFRPMRSFQHYTRQHGPLMSAGIGFNMFFSITGLLATGFSIAGLVLGGKPALLDTIIASVAPKRPGAPEGERRRRPGGSAGPAQPGRAWLDGPHRRRRHGHSSLGWIAGLRDGVRGVMSCLPLVVNPVLKAARRRHPAAARRRPGDQRRSVPGFRHRGGWVTDFLASTTVAGPLTARQDCRAAGTELGHGAHHVPAGRRSRSCPAAPCSREPSSLAFGTTILQVFSTELLAGAGRNPILAPFAIIIGLLIWFNLVSQVYLVSRVGRCPGGGPGGTAHRAREGHLGSEAGPAGQGTGPRGAGCRCCPASRYCPAKPALIRAARAG